MAKASDRPLCDICNHKHWKYEPHAWKGPETCETKPKIGTVEHSPTAEAAPNRTISSVPNVDAKSKTVICPHAPSAETQSARSKFDRNAYQKSYMQTYMKDYMKKYRKRQKEAREAALSSSTPS